MACLFCDIVAGTIPATLVYRGPGVTAFRDISPRAPTHILVVPNRHFDGVASLGEGDANVLSELIATANRLAVEEGVAESGYRLVVNSGEHGGQTVQHLHLHLLGGRPMTWPPG